MKWVISRAGFVSRDSCGADIFLHRSQITSPSPGLAPSEVVTFTLDRQPDGLRALDVHTV